MKIKLVIWDLDDTLWAGTLAEGDDVKLFAERADIIRTLNSSGVVSAICSKNNFAEAQAKLEAFGLWEEFVFPRIAFIPKGEAVRQLIEDMQLRPANTLFVDDNHHNLEEVRHVMPDIHVLNAAAPECDDVLRKIVADNADIRKSRVEEYRMLENKLRDQQVSSVSQEDFLASCGIHLCLIPLEANLPYAARIEELINRTNQLNFTKSRVPEGSIAEYVTLPMRHKAYSVVVWDKYGYYGLVGFAAADGWRPDLRHFAFSCRIMHMGIEQYVLAKLLEMHPKLKVENLGVTPSLGVWITEERYKDKAIHAFITSNEIKQKAEPQLRIMAYCQSGAIAHFAGLTDISIVDNEPHVFNLRALLNDSHLQQEFPKRLVYAVFSDYYDLHWPKNIAHFEDEVFEAASRKLAQYVTSRDTRMLVILGPENANENKYINVTLARTRHFNGIWRRIAEEFDAIEVLDTTELAETGELIDARHFEVTLLKKIADTVKSWYHAHALPAPKVDAGAELVQA